jgi:hypothetical protein
VRAGRRDLESCPTASRNPVKIMTIQKDSTMRFKNFDFEFMLIFNQCCGSVTISNTGRTWIQNSGQWDPDPT